MKQAIIVFRKEFSEIIRDKRVRSNAIIVPMFLVFGLLALMGMLSGIGEKKNQKVHVVAASNPLVDDLKSEGFQVIEIASLDEGKKLIESGKARLVLEFPPETATALANGNPIQVQAYIDPQETAGEIALRMTQGTLMKRNAAVMAKVLVDNGITSDQIAPIQVVENKVIVGKEDTSEFLLSMLPYFIVIWAFYGGLGPAGDLVAGEKEKMTLETLLITPVDRGQIAIGKFLAVGAVCLMSSLSALMGFVIAGLSGIPQFKGVFPNGLEIGATEFVLILLALLPTVAFFASLLLAVSTYAKNAREAQSYLALISFVVIMPAIFGQFIGFTDIGSNLFVRFVPVLNTSMAVREALQGKPNMLGLGITVAVGVVLASIGIYAALRMFRREQVLTRI
ncbi:MAG: ABC transporter permease [Fimbriimonadaceae bacterium]|nr:ABC transporter permease [Fimbriimonadaceae bacterium]